MDFRPPESLSLAENAIEDVIVIPLAGFREHLSPSDCHLAAVDPVNKKSSMRDRDGRSVGIAGCQRGRARDGPQPCSTRPHSGDAS